MRMRIERTCTARLIVAFACALLCAGTALMAQAQTMSHEQAAARLLAARPQCAAQSQRLIALKRAEGNTSSEEALLGIYDPTSIVAENAHDLYLPAYRQPQDTPLANAIRQYQVCLLEATRAGGPSTASAGPSPSSSPQQSAINDLARQQLAQCTAEVRSIGQRFQTAEAAIPRDDIIHRSEAIMWFTSESNAAIARLCPGQYASDVQSFQELHDNTRRTCSAVSANPPCVARLPGQQPASLVAPNAPSAPPAVAPATSTPTQSTQRGPMCAVNTVYNISYSCECPRGSARNGYGPQTFACSTGNTAR